MDEGPVSLFMRMPKNTFNYCMSQYYKDSAYTMSFNVFEAGE